MTNIYIGTSGWIYDSWEGKFYPENLSQNKWLDFYAHEFATVEINYSFYKQPSRETFEKWGDEVGKQFVFAVKASRYLTHMNHGVAS